MPSFLLQPLVENVVRHGVHESKQRTTIRVSAAAAGDALTLRIADDGRGLPPDAGLNEGIGLRNTRRRLAELYGAAARLEVDEPRRRRDGGRRDDPAAGRTGRRPDVPRLRTMIVDDEALARERIRTLLAGWDDIELVAECASGHDAVAAVRRLRPALLFLDIQMPELDGFGVLQALPPPYRPEAIVFVTAHDRFAVHAFDVNAIDYLLKPYTAERFNAALERARARLGGGGRSQRAEIDALLESVAARMAVPERLTIRSRNGIQFVPVQDVDWLEADRNYTVLHLGTQALRIRETISELESQLGGGRIRARAPFDHRQRRPHFPARAVGARRVRDRPAERHEGRSPAAATASACAASSPSAVQPKRRRGPAFARPLLRRILEVRPNRSGRGSSPWSMRRRSRARTSAARRRMRRLRRVRGVASSNRR